ncbi:MAG TPA: hypothetical protein VID68_14530 [Solirubrobacteraceae bacterium]
MAESSEQPRRTQRAIRLLAAALAGAIGAFGAPAAALRSNTVPSATAPVPAAAPDTRAE